MGEENRESVKVGGVGLFMWARMEGIIIGRSFSWTSF